MKRIIYWPVIGVGYNQFWNKWFVSRIIVITLAIPVNIVTSSINPYYLFVGDSVYAYKSTTKCCDFYFSISVHVDHRPINRSVCLVVLKSREISYIIITIYVTRFFRPSKSPRRGVGKIRCHCRTNAKF